MCIYAHGLTAYCIIYYLLTYLSYLFAGPGRVSELIKECNEKLDALKSKYVSKLNENGVSN